MQTILIPTDFRLNSFNCIPSLCHQLKGQKIKIVFTHLFKLSDSITDLLMLSKRIKEYEYVSEDFYQECQRFKGGFDEINSISIEFFYGSTLAAFKNFLSTHQVTYILDPATGYCSPLNKSSVDPASLIAKANIPVLRANKLTVVGNHQQKEELEEA